MLPSRTGTNDPEIVRGRVGTGVPIFSWKSPLTKNTNTRNVTFYSGCGWKPTSLDLHSLGIALAKIFHVLTEQKLMYLRNSVFNTQTFYSQDWLLAVFGLY